MAERELSQAMVRVASEMAAGMLRHPVEAEVLQDLSPSVVPVQEEALGKAERSMWLARRTELNVATTYALGAIPRTVAALESEMPALYQQFAAQARSSSTDSVAHGIADFVVCVTFVKLLPVFEAEMSEHPRHGDQDDILGAFAGYVRMIDEFIAEMGPKWDRVRTMLAEQGIEWSRFSDRLSSSYASGGFRVPICLDFLGRPLCLVDDRVAREGEAARAFQNPPASGVERLAAGGFVVWTSGARGRAQSTLEAALVEAQLHMLGTA